MKTLTLLVSFIGGLVLFSCQTKPIYDESIKELDSLKIVIQQALVNFKTIDSAACYNAQYKQSTYLHFLETHLKDTISKQDAEQIQQFQSLKSGFDTYVKYRSNWIQRAQRSIHQLQTLTNDLKNGSVNHAEVVSYINEEKTNAFQTIEVLKTNTDNMRKHLELYNQYLPAYESIIKKLNAGVLPQLITTNS